MQRKQSVLVVRGLAAFLFALFVLVGCSSEEVVDPIRIPDGEYRLVRVTEQLTLDSEVRVLSLSGDIRVKVKSFPCNVGFDSDGGSVDPYYINSRATFCFTSLFSGSGSIDNEAVDCSAPSFKFYALGANGEPHSSGGSGYRECLLDYNPYGNWTGFRLLPKGFRRTDKTWLVVFHEEVTKMIYEYDFDRM